MPPPEIAATRKILADLSETTAAQMVFTWNRLGSWQRRDLPRFTAAAKPLVVASSTTAVRTQAALVGSLTGTDLGPIDVAKIAGHRMATIDQPFTAYWHALSEGRAWDEALAAGQSATEAFGRDIAYQSARETLTATETTWTRYTRDVSGSSCEWCQSFIGVEWDNPDSATFGHERCDCIAVPVT